MSEREDWINLIHNEYDPRPNLGKADYSGFEWDDGTGRIADAIMADKVLALREAVDRIEALEAALRLAIEELGWGEMEQTRNRLRAALTPEPAK